MIVDDIPIQIRKFRKLKELRLAHLVQVGLCGRHDAMRCGMIQGSRGGACDNSETGETR